MTTLKNHVSNLQNVGQTRWARWSRGTRRCSAPFSATPRNISDSTETVCRRVVRTDRRVSIRSSRSWTWTRTPARRRRSCARTGRPRATLTPRSARTTTARRARTITWRSTATSATHSRSPTRTNAVPDSRWRRAAKRATRATDVASPNKRKTRKPPPPPPPPPTHREGPRFAFLPHELISLFLPLTLTMRAARTRPRFAILYRSSRRGFSLVDTVRTIWNDFGKRSLVPAVLTNWCERDWFWTFRIFLIPFFFFFWIWRQSCSTLNFLCETDLFDPFRVYSPYKWTMRK